LSYSSRAQVLRTSISTRSLIYTSWQSATCCMESKLSRGMKGQKGQMKQMEQRKQLVNFV